MSKHRLVLWGLVAILLSCLALLFLVPPAPISRENFARIRIGMTEQQVESILGGPAHQSRKFHSRLDPETGELVPANGMQKRWVGADNSISISVDEDGVVFGADFFGDDWPSFPQWRVLAGGLLLVAVLTLLGYLWRVHWFPLTIAISVLCGMVVPIVAGLGGYGFGAYLAIGLCLWFACLVAYFRPKSAILFVAVFTGTAAAVNYWGHTAAGMRGAGDLMVFWGIWAFLMGFSLPALVLGDLVGWSNRAFAERLRQLRGEGSSSPPAGNPAEPAAVADGGRGAGSS